MKKSQEPKYAVNTCGQIVNRSTGKAIPDDEPVMIFRAKDDNAVAAITYYKELCKDRTHKKAVNERMHDFVDFANDNPDLMGEPDA